MVISKIVLSLFYQNQITMNITIWDNNGQTYDQYTILDNTTGDVWGCSTNPSHPLGFGQYSHNVVENMFGHDWEESRYPKRFLQVACTAYRKDSKHLGKKVKYETLPEKVQQYIQYLTTVEEC